MIFFASPLCDRTIANPLERRGAWLRAEQSDRHGAGSTHAWAEIFVPGAGWISFDPTNRGMGAPDAYFI